MAIVQTDRIAVGTIPNDKTGDDFRVASIKSNGNFDAYDGAISSLSDDMGDLTSAVGTQETQISALTATVGNAVRRGQTPVNDANYQVIASDVDVAFTALTAARAVKLCDVDTYPLGQDLVIGDESGACSQTNTITIVVGDGTGDTIPQQSDGTIVLAYAYASVRLRRGAANIWKIV